MNKEKLGKYIFYIVILVSLILVFFGGNIIKYFFKGLDQNLFARLKYLLEFIAFTVFLPIGLIIREYSSLEYDERKMKLKIIVNISVFVIGLILWFILKTPTQSGYIMYAGIINLIYMIIPSKIDENKKI